MGRLLLASIAFALLIGCQSEGTIDFDKESTLIIKEQINDTGDFTVLKRVEDKSDVNSYVNFFEGLDWDINIDIDFEKEPDYQINNYGIWVTPNGNRLEIKNLDNSNYASLKKDDSKTLCKMLTGKQLEESK